MFNVLISHGADLETFEGTSKIHPWFSFLSARLLLGGITGKPSHQLQLLPNAEGFY